VKVPDGKAAIEIVPEFERLRDDPVIPFRFVSFPEILRGRVSGLVAIRGYDRDVIPSLIVNWRSAYSPLVVEYDKEDSTILFFAPGSECERDDDVCFWPADLPDAESSLKTVIDSINRKVAKAKWERFKHDILRLAELD